MKVQIYLNLEVDAGLTVEECWPDGDAPALSEINVEKVEEVIRQDLKIPPGKSLQGRDLMPILSGWGLDDGLDLRISVSRVLEPSDLTDEFLEEYVSLETKEARMAKLQGWASNLLGRSIGERELQGHLVLLVHQTPYDTFEDFVAARIGESG